jgi:hypothetical protein
MYSQLTYCPELAQLHALRFADAKLLADLSFR